MTSSRSTAAAERWRKKNPDTYYLFNRRRYWVRALAWKYVKKNFPHLVVEFEKQAAEKYQVRSLKEIRRAADNG
jgi:hypothetical protein